ncbi:hypothetical protein C3F09_02020 [candidate division GN15 bacterium]|uniref:Cytochrome c assembly protein domain-containing protein n=1 Tax=candidate division GN15 bacterium TaxID=2072418 RepID=A0A855X3U5_9BACT|nr:MAG: hypothetical protein C3F09_02020 [candidate division GN15 bacterium]
MAPNLPGDLLIFLALGFNAVAGVAYLLLARGRQSFDNLARSAYHLFTIMTGLAVTYLFFLFFSHNYAIKYVYEYSERAQSSFYILSAFWGGQEGTYLLWLFFNALFGYVIIKRGGLYRNYGMAVLSLVNLFFLAILVKLSPFALLPAPAPDGLGLNPLLRDPWMVVHPPVIFIGYAMAAIPFAFAMAALIRNDFSSWLRRSFPWVVITMLMLAAGNILGGFWAYKTLGWGGFWAWDPVENSSFIPWVMSLALVHGLIIERRSGALRRVNLMLASFVFLLVVYGTFLTRSGVLADFSVHSFTDLGINNLLIAFMLVSLVLTVVMVALRWRSVPTAPLHYNYFGREFTLFAGLVVLSIFGLIVLFWTSLPLLTKAVGAEPRAADVATYNQFAIPFVILMAFLLTVSPMVQFVEYQVPNLWRKLAAVLAGAIVLALGVFFLALHTTIEFAVLLAAVLAGITVYLFKPDLVRQLIPALVVFVLTIVVSLLVGVRDYLFLLFFATALMAATSNIISLLGYLPNRWKLMGGQLTHFGFGIMVVGILASSAFTTSDKLIIPKGESREGYGLSVAYNGMANDFRHPNNELLLQVAHGRDTTQARPQLYYSERMQGTMRKPYIRRTPLMDYYMAPEQIKEGDEGSGITLVKGESQKIGNFELTFRDYDMGSHGDTSQTSRFRVGAKIDVVANGISSSIEPAIEQEIDKDGKATNIASPAMISSGGKTYFAELIRVLADQKAVVLNIPGLTDVATPETLVLDISRKPLINFVWGGAILTLIGSIITFIRRREESVVEPASD